MSGITDYFANAALNAVFNAQSFAVSQIWLQLHVGDPGPSGSANPAANNTRLRVTTSVAVGREWTNANALVWPLTGFYETYTHVSLWDSSTNGNPIWSGPLQEPVAVNADDSFTLPTSTVVVSLT